MVQVRHFPGCHMVQARLRHVPLPTLVNHCLGLVDPTSNFGPVNRLGKPVNIYMPRPDSNMKFAALLAPSRN